MQKEQTNSISTVFAQRFRRHLLWIFLRIAVWLAVLGFVAWATTTAYFLEGAPGYLAAFSLAAFLFFLAAFALGLRDTFRVRVLPYYERRLGTVQTFLTGKSLLANSGVLDDIARQLAVRPLSDFASGDDLVWFEKLVWHDPKEALQTAERLLNSEPAKSFSQELISDLTRLREALEEARSKDVRFCLLLREGSCTSGYEMDRRKGSFF